MGDTATAVQHVAPPKGIADAHAALVSAYVASSRAFSDMAQALRYVELLTRPQTAD
jgi:hypothetical protein